jgi:hypothetical protein
MRNNQRPKPISKSEKVLQMCKLIGIETFKDLQTFKKQEQRQGETTLQALERYLLELLEE